MAEPGLVDNWLEIPSVVFFCPYTTHLQFVLIDDTLLPPELLPGDVQHITFLVGKFGLG